VAQAVLQSGQKIDVAQCGYCQPGQIMSAIALLEQTPVPTDVVGSDYHKCIGREGALVSSDLCFGESAPALRKPEA
jgi:aerobic-type carbon monoxide dehydrogenase small subunit (CoxS/CutS family)